MGSLRTLAGVSRDIGLAGPARSADVEGAPGHHCCRHRGPEPGRGRPAQGLRQAASIQRRQFEIMYDVIVLYQEAARTDPDIAADMARILANHCP
jgi:hypothetical protein